VNADDRPSTQVQAYWFERAKKLELEVERLQEERDRLAELLRDLHAEVEMGEAVGICLPDRTASLRAGEALVSLPVREEK
jgi:hypothetical protein